MHGVVELLTADALLTMPPTPLEYEGPAAIAAFLSTVPAGGRLDLFRLVPTRANGQPAFGCYLRDAHAPVAHAYGLMVLTLRRRSTSPPSPASPTPACSPTSACPARCAESLDMAVR